VGRSNPGPTEYYMEQAIAESMEDSAMMPAVSTHRDESRHTILGISLKFASVLCLAGMASCVKYLGSAVPAGQVVFFRGVIAMVVIAAVAWRGEGLHVLKTRNWRMHASRSLAGAFSMFCWFISLTLIPFAEMTAISFTVPLFLTVLAMVFLREQIHWYRWTALGIGFAGVLIIVGPDLAASQGDPLGAGIALTAAVLAAFALMFLRRMSGHENALTITFYFFLTSTVLAVLSLVFEPWPMPSRAQWLPLAMVGIFGVMGQLTMTYSYRYAEASLIAPLDYVNMLIAIAIGFYIFGEIPHVSTWIGAPLIISAGGVILWREYVKLKRIRSLGRIEP
jgi:drug/metabolite transporter (DMT)-like permease